MNKIKLKFFCCQASNKNRVPSGSLNYLREVDCGFNQDCSFGYFNNSYLKKSSVFCMWICSWSACYKEIRWLNTQKRCSCDSQIYTMSYERYIFSQELLKNKFHHYRIAETDIKFVLTKDKFHLETGLGFTSFVGFMRCWNFQCVQITEKAKHTVVHVFSGISKGVEKETFKVYAQCLHDFVSKKIVFYLFFTMTRTKKKRRKLNTCSFVTIVCEHFLINRQYVSMFQKILFRDIKNCNLS